MKKLFDKIVILISIIIIGLLCVTILLRLVTRMIFVRHFGIQNDITDIIFFDNDSMKSGDLANSMVNIDWAEKYPFVNTVETEMDDIVDLPYYEDLKTSDSSMIVHVYEKADKIKSLTEKVETYSSDYLVGYDAFVKMSNEYENLIGWNFASFAEYNGVVKLNDDYLVTYKPYYDTEEHSEALISFNEYCHNQGIDMMYVLVPAKICTYQDDDKCGSVDFTNKNADELISHLNMAGVDFLDLREVLHEEGLNHHKMFYKTDHHWTTTTGIWASQKVLNYCNEHYDLGANTDKMTIDHFELETYPNSFLGSEGKKVTEARTEKDDFSLVFPKFDVKLHYQVPSRGVDKIGDYNVCYDYDMYPKDSLNERIDYPISNYGDQPLIMIENLLLTEDPSTIAGNKKILVIHDSFGDVTLSVMALGIGHVDSLDLRYFSGSVETFVEETDPDVVIVMYNACASGGTIEWNDHKDLFDFR